MKAGFFRISLSILVLSGFSAPALADTYQPIPHCYKPTKPLWFSTSYYTDRYAEDVSTYKNCLKAFITAQEYAAQQHQEAAQNALEVWNDFVK